MHTGGSDTSGWTPGNRVWQTLVVLTATGSLVVTSVGGITLNEGPFVGSTATGVELSTLDIDTVLFAGSDYLVRYIGCCIL